MGATDTLAQLVEGTELRSLPPEVVRGAKTLILDTLGVAVAASRSRLGRSITGYAAESGAPGAAELIGSGRAVAPEPAALANGTLCSTLDFDGGYHIPTFVLPAVLAAAQASGAGGRAVLEGFVAGFEAAETMRFALDGRRDEDRVGLTARGWYHVGIVGPLAAALAAGRVLGLAADRLRTAMALAATATGGVRQNFGTAGKPLQAGAAASAGVRAALLAARGLTADPSILEAPLGLGVVFGAGSGGDPASAWPEPRWARGGFALAGQLRMKRYPSVSPSHAAISALLEVRGTHGLTADDVEDVTCVAPRPAVRRAFIRPDAADEVEAGFSLPFLLAVALVDGEMGLRQVEERVHAPDVRRVMARVRVEAAAPDDPEGHLTRVALRLRDGRRVEGAVGPTPYLREDEVAGKYEACVAHAGVAEAGRAVRQRVEALEDVGDVRGLLAGLAAGGGAA